MVEEATNGNPGGPDARTLKMISRAAFEVDDYWRIVDILHNRCGCYQIAGFIIFMCGFVLIRVI